MVNPVIKIVSEIFVFFLRKTVLLTNNKVTTLVENVSDAVI